MGASAKIARWFVRWVLGLGLPTLALYYAVLHLGMGLPVGAILVPWFVLWLLTLVAAPLLHWLADRARRRGGDFRVFFIAVGAVGMAGASVLLHYASVLGLVSPDVARGSLVAGLIAIPPCVLLVYHFRRDLLPEHFWGSPDSR